MQFHNYHRSNRVCSKETEGTRMKTVPEVTIKETWEIYDEVEEALVAYHSPEINVKWVKLSDLKKLLDELNPDEISEDVHDFIMETFKPKRWGWAKDISPIVWKFWNKLLEAFE